MMAQPETIAARRLLQQRIHGELSAHPAEVVRWMGAMQAQDYGQAVWAIGLRTRKGRLEEVERDISDGKIVRTWPMRGTLHFVPAEDAGWMTAISATRTLAAMRGRQAQLGINAATLEGAQQVFADRLSGGKQCTRAEMMDALGTKGIPTSGQRGYHLLVCAALQGLICLGPVRGKQQTFVLLAEWAPNARTLAREDSLAELARRYFSSHGPASLADFARWAGLTMRDARTGLEGARDALTCETLDGSEYWLPADAEGLPEAETEGIDLLPGFDEYLLGYADRAAMLAAEHAQKVTPGNNGIFRAVMVADGQVIGTWRRVVKKKGIEITLEPFQPVGAAEERALPAAQGYADFLGVPLANVRSYLPGSG